MFLLSCGTRVLDWRMIKHIYGVYLTVTVLLPVA